VTRRLLALATLLALGACGSGDDEDVPPAVVLRVFSGPPLEEVFDDLAEQFVAIHDDVRIDFTYADPAMLLAEVERGRAAAVLATADTETMDNAEERGLLRDRFDVARAPDGRRFEIAVLTTAVAPTEARQWVDFVRGAEGRRVLEEHGFDP
jgi:ABC-type molybdate transport system substrate-binding protein